MSNGHINGIVPDMAEPKSKCEDGSKLKSIIIANRHVTPGDDAVCTITHSHHDHVKFSSDVGDKSDVDSERQNGDIRYHGVEPVNTQRRRTSSILSKIRDFHFGDESHKHDGDHSHHHHHHHPHHIRRFSRQISAASSVFSDFFSFKRNDSVTLPRRVGLGSAVALLMGIMLGTGIFVAPQGVLKYTGSVGASLVVWIMCGVIAMVGAIVFAELALMFPKSGGDHTYLQETYGEILAFLHGWGALLIVRPTSLAIVSLVLGEYIVYPHYTTVQCVIEEQLAAKLFAAVFIVFLVFVHASGLKIIFKLQIFLTVIKVALLLIIIITGMIKIAEGHTVHLAPDTSFQGSTRDAFAYGIAFFQGMFAYEGWNTLNYAVEELKDPYKTLPRAIYVAIPLITVLYVLTNVAYYTVLTPSQVLESHAIAMTFAMVTMGNFYKVIPFLVVFAAFGTANGLCYSLSRMTIVLGREGHMPKVMSMVHPDSVSPILALFTMACISLVMLTLPVNLEHMIEFLSFAVWLSYSLIALAHIILRIREPDIPRPFRAHWSLSLFLFVVSLFFVIAPFFESYSLNSLLVLAILTSGLIFYVPFVKKKYYPSWMDKFTIFCQLFFNIVPTKYQTPEEHAEEKTRQGSRDNSESS